MISHDIISYHVISYKYEHTQLSYDMLRHSPHTAPPLVANGAEDFNAANHCWWMASLQFMTIVSIFCARCGSEILDELFTSYDTINDTKIISHDVEQSSSAPTSSVTVSHVHTFKRGMFILSFAIVFGLLTASIMFCIIYVIFHDEIDRATIWNHVLHIATCPLFFMNHIGNFSDCMNYLHGDCACSCSCDMIGDSHSHAHVHHHHMKQGHMSWAFVTFLRAMLVLVGAILGYFFIHLVIMPTHLLGDNKWWSSYELEINFTVAQFCLGWSFFLGKYVS